ncbi:MAG: cytochrome c [Phycisphaerae bacterium]|nr:cytochrome c [Phycisphaerae bacterium]
MKHTMGPAAALSVILLLGGCGGIGEQETGEGPDGSVAVEGPDPNQSVANDSSDSNGLFTDDPVYSNDEPSGGSGDDSDTSDSRGETPPAEDEESPEPEPEPEPEPLPGSVSNGRALYRLNCQECHGVDAIGGTAVGIRRASVAKITAYINGANQHPQFGGFSGFTTDDVQDIAAYLNGL